MLTSPAATTHWAPDFSMCTSPRVGTATAADIFMLVSPPEISAIDALWCTSAPPLAVVTTEALC